ncbi:MAG: zinc-binding dehydrogenase [Actinobacteria bacterium]|nr:zinc-binding dehydrogenase [Actinomycetota bacterium]
MRAWYLSESPGQYSIGEVTDPLPGPDEVRIAVRASALNHMDLWLTTGMPKPPRFPHVPGNDVAGVVESLGEGVTTWSLGDEVVVNTALVPDAALSRGVNSVLDPGMRLLGEHCWGGHGEFCVVPAHQLCAKPPERSWAEVASYPVCTTTAWRLFRRADLQAGESVLVTGIGGGVATAAFSLAQHLGCEVYVTSRDESKRQRAIELGAAGAFDSSGPYPVTVDVVVDSIGPAVWDNAFRTLRHGGRMLVCGGTSGPKVELNLPRLFFKQLDVIGASCGSQVEFEHVSGLVADGLPVIVDEVIPLAEYPRALDRLREARQLGKIVLEHPSS